MNSSPAQATVLQAVATLVCASLTLADVQFNDFSSTAGLTMLGATAQSGSRLRLVPATPDQAGAAWFETKQDVTDSFATQFFVELEPENGAEGFTFTIQNTALNAIGGSGCELGYEGLANSVAIEFDFFTSVTCGVGAVDDPGSIHVSVHTLGTAPNSVLESASLGSTTIVPNFANGAVHQIRIDYVPGTLQIFIDGFLAPVLQVPIDIGATLALDADKAWVGFTASTGSLAENQELIAWFFTEHAFGPPSNQPPAAPAITEPSTNGQELNPADVHMETSAFSDPDLGDLHECTDFELWTIQPSARIWSSACSSGVEKLHTHLGDGVFEGSHTGRTELLPSTPYVLRARHKDDSGEAQTEWSPWGERDFVTGSASQVFPLVLEDVADQPAPAWVRDTDQGEVVLSAGNASVRIETGLGQLLLEFAGNDGVTNTVTNPGPLVVHEAVRVRIDAGSAGLTLPETNLLLADEHCDFHRALLPDVQLAPLQVAYFWVSSSGSTYVGNAAQTMPDFSVLARGLDLPWVFSEPGYEIDVFATGFQLPVKIAFIPNAGTNPGDPYFYVTELYGTIKVVTRDGTVSDYATGLLNFNPSGNFPGSGEQGLSGIAVDPATGDVFAGMLYSVGGPHYPKVVHFTSLDGGLSASTQTTILDMAGESQGQSHFISNLAIHPNGKLIVHMGDGFSSSTALNLSSYRGKILRLNLDGSAPTDNPFYDLADGINARDYVFAYGVRNPFGGAWRASDGLHYEVENGPSTDRFAQVISGRNFGWNGSEASMQNFALHNWVPSTGPVNLAFVQPETFGGSGFPDGKMGHAFVTLSGGTYASGPQALGKRIEEFELDANGNVVAGPTTFIEYTGSGKATAVGLAAGPDGLYMSDLYADGGPSPTTVGANILRIRFTAEVDCNANGIHDGCDIASGTSADVNGNGIPDECECVGTAFCSSTPNSTGVPATIDSRGDCTVAANAFVLEASNVPDQPGLFFYGAGQLGGGAGVPFFNGRQCVGGAQVFRLPVVMATAGTATYTVDFGNPPNPAGTITAGSTWNFQYWFRDPAGGGQFVDLSDGLELTFQ
ncbi:MAG: hypothetical protein E2O39_11470 [Planctomycetota bacterium]|nr:MAG: hypothetical protein E2O39_11470 [Planctomycetota bacterium]